MPFAATNDFFGAWTLGAIACQIWTVLDVCLCTASILHLVAIAMDRYLSITNVRYIQGRSVRLMYIVLALIWGMSLVRPPSPLVQSAISISALNTFGFSHSFPGSGCGSGFGLEGRPLLRTYWTRSVLGFTRLILSNLWYFSPIYYCQIIEFEDTISENLTQ